VVVLDGSVVEGSLVLGGLVFGLCAAQHDMGRLQIVRSDLCRLKTSIQVLVVTPALRAIARSKLVGTASTVSPPRVEDAGNGHSTSQQSFCRLPCG
jgi:hypothetical protein